MNELNNYDAFVMGRVTYERLRAIWEPVTGSPYIDAINRMPKHVATRSLRSLEWNATPLGHDPIATLAVSRSNPAEISSNMAPVDSTPPCCGRVWSTRSGSGSCRS
jgi:dihydrofolate reductase